MEGNGDAVMPLIFAKHILLSVIPGIWPFLGLILVKTSVFYASVHSLMIHFNVASSKFIAEPL